MKKLSIIITISDYQSTLRYKSFTVQQVRIHCVGIGQSQIYQPVTNADTSNAECMLHSDAGICACAETLFDLYQLEVKRKTPSFERLQREQKAVKMETEDRFMSHFDTTLDQDSGLHHFSRVKNHA